MEQIRNGGANNAALPLAGGDLLRRNLPRNLYRVGAATGATAVAGLVMPLVAAEDSPLSQRPVVFLLFAILLVAAGTISLGYRLERAPTLRLREFGVVAYFVCLLLMVAALVIVRSNDYWQLALNFIADI